MASALPTAPQGVSDRPTNASEVLVDRPLLDPRPRHDDTHGEHDRYFKHAQAEVRDASDHQGHNPEGETNAVCLALREWHVKSVAREGAMSGRFETPGGTTIANEEERASPTGFENGLRRHGRAWASSSPPLLTVPLQGIPL